jgi:hypothetical protein
VRGGKDGAGVGGLMFAEASLDVVVEIVIATGVLIIELRTALRLMSCFKSAEALFSSDTF